MGQQRSSQSNVHPFAAAQDLRAKDARAKDTRSPDHAYRLPAAVNDAGRAPAVTASPDAAGLDLLALLAHQLITPLAQIDSAAQKMARHADAMDPSEVRTRATRIHHATRRLSTLAHAILDRARLEGGQSAVREVCSLADLIAKACEPVRQAQPQRLFWIDLTTATVLGDPLFLEQLLAILICNAAKYSDPDAAIGITATETPAGIVLAVTDHGIGIAAQDRDRLFEPCFRGCNVGSAPGAGMGLHLAGHIAALHGGTITVESREGEGSTFTVTLPRT